MAEGASAPSERRQTLLVVFGALGLTLLLFLGWYFFIRTPYLPAFTGVDSADAVTITQELDRLKTPYVLDDNGSTISVPEDQVNAARINILGGELPLKGAVGFELFNKSDMGLTEFAQKINYQRALQGELARTIMALEEVDTARVHLSLPEAGIFEQDRRPAKASITVATKLGGNIEANVVRGIQQLVAAAVPDLQAADVAVLNARGELLSDVPIEAVPAVATAEQQRRAEYEGEVSSRIEDAIRAAGLSIALEVKVTALRGFDDAPQADRESDEITDAAIEPRSWPLNVDLVLDSQPNAAVRAKLVEAARTAMNFDATVGDRLNLRTTTPPLAAPRPPSTPGEALPKQETSPVTILLWWIVPLAALALLALLLFWRSRRPSSRTMTVEQRDDFAEKLRSLLQEDRNGQSSV